MFSLYLIIRNINLDVTKTCLRTIWWFSFLKKCLRNVLLTETKSWGNRHLIKQRLCLCQTDRKRLFSSHYFPYLFIFFASHVSSSHFISSFLCLPLLGHILTKMGRFWNAPFSSADWDPEPAAHAERPSFPQLSSWTRAPLQDPAASCGTQTGGSKHVPMVIALVRFHKWMLW